MKKPDFDLEGFHEMLCDSIIYAASQIDVLMPLIASGLLSAEQRQAAIGQANVSYCMEILIAAATSNGIISRESLLEMTIRRRGTEAAKLLEEFFDAEERVWRGLQPKAPAFDLSKMKGPK